MIFLIILALTTAMIASAAAFFSIYGLAQIFAGSFWAVVIMASTLELGKLVTASYVYRFWSKISIWMKGYLISAVAILMLITSAGVFGFLANAHQKSMIDLDQSQQKIVLLEQSKSQAEQLKAERLKRRDQIDNDIANLPSNYVRGRQKLMKEYGEERKRIEADVQKYTAEVEATTKEIGTLKLGELEQKTHVGPILYVAEALNKDVNTAIIWMIYLIMFAFDPLAVALTVAFNIALRDREQEKVTEDDENEEPLIDDELDEPTPLVSSLDHLPRTTSGDVDDIRHAIEELNRKQQPSAEDDVRKGVLEEMLRRRDVTTRVRNPNQP